MRRGPVGEAPASGLVPGQGGHHGAPGQGHLAAVPLAEQALGGHERALGPVHGAGLARVGSVAGAALGGVHVHVDPGSGGRAGLVASPGGEGPAGGLAGDLSGIDGHGAGSLPRRGPDSEGEGERGSESGEEGGWGGHPSGRRPFPYMPTK